MMIEFFHNRRRVKSVIQGVLPGVALKIFMILLPTILTTMSKVEGHISLSILERSTAGKYHFFVLVNVFFGSIITGTAFQQLDKFLHQAPSEYVTCSLYQIICIIFDISRSIFLDNECVLLKNNQWYVIITFTHVIRTWKWEQVNRNA